MDEKPIRRTPIVALGGAAATAADAVNVFVQLFLGEEQEQGEPIEVDATVERVERKPAGTKAVTTG